MRKQTSERVRELLEDAYEALEETRDDLEKVGELDESSSHDQSVLVEIVGDLGEMMVKLEQYSVHLNSGDDDREDDE